MKLNFLLLVLVVQLSGCTTTKWHCESDFAGIAEACTRAQMGVMSALPPECTHGADGKGSISAKSTNNGHNLPRHRSEAEIKCKKEVKK